MAANRTPVIVALGWMLASQALYAAAPDGGSTITNQATATFVDSAGQSQTLRSNTVQTTVAQVASFTLVSSQSNTAAPGQTVNFPHTLTNTGNGTDTVDLSASDTFAGGFNFTGVTLYADATCDGVPDNATPITGTGALARNGQFCFVAAAVVPGSAAPGTSDQMTVTGQGNAAAASGGGYTAATAQSNTDVVTVIAAPGSLDLTLTKTHSGNFTVGRPGTYTLSVRNIGGTATSGPITVSDTLPPGLTFVPAGSGGVSWSCSAAGQIVSCTSPVVIPAASPHPNALTVVVNPSAVALAASPVTNTATVSGGSEPLTNGGNNGASDPTLIDDTARLSGRVWRDLSHDRRYDAGESLLKSFIVDFMDASNKVLRSARTNAGGAYSFKDVTPGAGYRLRFRDPATGHPVRGMPVDGEQGTPVSGATVTNGILENLTLSSGDNIAEQSLPLDPSGVVYDAITRRPVAGAVVALRGPASFKPSTQLLGGRGNLAQTTGATGQYQFLLLSGAPSGAYTLAVTAPPRYRPFPSTLIPPAASAGGCPQTNCLDPTGLAGPGLTYPIVSLGSAPPAGAPTTYFLRFRLNLASDPSIVNNHLPLDPTSFDGSGLLVQKSATRNIVEIGEFVDYTVQIRNSTSLRSQGSTSPIGCRPDSRISKAVPGSMARPYRTRPAARGLCCASRASAP